MATTASAIKNVSMTYVPTGMSLCLFLSRRGCSKLLTIDNKCGGPVLSLQPFPARSQEQHGRGAPVLCVQTDAIYFGADHLLSIHRTLKHAADSSTDQGWREAATGHNDLRKHPEL
jgi:hypothetical protein